MDFPMKYRVFGVPGSHLVPFSAMESPGPKLRKNTFPGGVEVHAFAKNGAIPPPETASLRSLGYHCEEMLSRKTPVLFD